MSFPNSPLAIPSLSGTINTSSEAFHARPGLFGKGPMTVHMEDGNKRGWEGIDVQRRNIINVPGQANMTESTDASGIGSPVSVRDHDRWKMTADPGGGEGGGQPGEHPRSPGGSIGARSSNDQTKPVDHQDDKSSTIPPWSELKTKAGKDRKRLPLACIACRRKKIRCSGEKPACKHCLRSRIPCVYKVTTRKAAPRTDYMAMLDKRLKRMEERVIKTIPKEEFRAMSGIGRAVLKGPLPGGQSRLTAGKKRPAEEAFEDELAAWPHPSQKPVDGIVALSTAQSRPQPKGADSEDSGLLSEGAEHLPSKEIQEHLAEVFFDFVYGQSYYLLHKPSYMRQLRAGSLPPVLVLAVCAVSARFSTHPSINSEPAFLRGDEWAKVARRISLSQYDEPNIVILLVYIILGLHEFGTCHGGRSWMLGGMAQRMAFALQLHHDLDHDPTRKQGPKVKLSLTERETRRRAMWACFVMDRFNSSGTERPMFINEDCLKIALPIKENLYQMEIPGQAETLDGSSTESKLSDGRKNTEINLGECMGVAAYLVRVIAIWGQVIQYVNLGGKQVDPFPPWSPQSKFYVLKARVEDFQRSLPQSLHYTPENLHKHVTERLANQFIFMHIISHQAALFVNRSAVTAATGGMPPKDTPQWFLNDIGRCVVAAANQVSALIHEAMDYNVVAPFVGYAAFFSSTIHILGVFSRNQQLEASSKENLAHNVQYLSKMKRYWGVFYFMIDSLKDIYQQHADAAFKNKGAGTSPRPYSSSVFQYGDWFDRYPHGVSEIAFENPAPDVKKEVDDSVLSQRPGLQTVEDFFAGVSPPGAKGEQSRKTSTNEQGARKSSKRTSKTAGSATAATGKARQQQLQPPKAQAQASASSSIQQPPRDSSRGQHEPPPPPHATRGLLPKPVDNVSDMVSRYSAPQPVSGSTALQTTLPPQLYQSEPQPQLPSPRHPSQPHIFQQNNYHHQPDISTQLQHHLHHQQPPPHASQQPPPPSQPQPSLPPSLSYTSYGGSFDPLSAAGPTAGLGSLSDVSIWGMDVNALNDGYLNEATNTWFGPFNLDPPDINGAAGGGAGAGGGISNGPDITGTSAGGLANYAMMLPFLMDQQHPPPALHQSHE
ncbi:hypothetical protein L228DRAFT_118154 [Xylona heveae TC161]|uniref:Zn(2)-C6 fungal-type domain-containing protein n=1 Tax=Xylona heveae (strain CBS 132557 / TC161) TaxID=1328760 RepID=A0A165HHG1_XYLHT|nr:hypothetical protein L228DRAFT_118154 [Xylona heveae TC161]KZF23525.1 hypothetical protein L228DRAFT_118154 [Xylona heveae TC161]